MRNRLRNFVIGLALGAAGVLLGAQNITIPNTFVNFTTADASQVNANFTALSANALNRAAGIFSGDATPASDNTINLGTNALRFANIRAVNYAGTGATFTGNGAALTALNASNITSGTVPQANLGNALLYGVAGGRCTASTGTPSPVTDVTAATTIYWTPYGPFAGFIGLYDGSAAWNIRTTTELSLSLGTDTADKNYDLFVFDNAGTPTLERLVWTNDTTRATALTTQNGIYVKTGATTRRYVCTYRTTGVAGQTEQSFAKQFVWNYYNRVPRALRVIEATTTWTYTLGTPRQANASTANQIDVVVGIAEVPIEVNVVGVASNGTAVTVIASIGEDSTTTQATGVLGAAQDLPVSVTMQIRASLKKYPAIGRHFYVWLESSGAAGTTTWRGTSAGFTAGIDGRIEG